MHELAVSQSLIAEAMRTALHHGAVRVTALTVQIGPLSGVEAPLLDRAFSVARAGTMLETSVLTMEIAPVVVWCPACQTETTVAPNALLCGQCGDWKVTLRSGDELVLKQVELDRETTDRAVLH
ncbi:hydrogenase maturation nickel metallochaperone HypA [Mesobacterium sp. TK19101]|uniref:Hydrogenase maturation factor HypA n=1 Tax=Mesobacterium hydrothermale TaxID=3111907 RepID=A0ABU6HNK9_9RHOB|nr:hydrogenase maturation nickel metallochaperone HypA [Mesobacterium sp. TK19101]MEC3862775.1 hydrogenase maturation nickel metallochaperone HypA [Mesobacterium sp. TK19101]